MDDIHNQDINKLSLTDREREICREALRTAQSLQCMGVYTALFGVLTSSLHRTRNSHMERIGELEGDLEQARGSAVSWEMAMRGLDAFAKDRAATDDNVPAQRYVDIAQSYMRQVAEFTVQHIAAERIGKAWRPASKETP